MGTSLLLTLLRPKKTTVGTEFSNGFLVPELESSDDVSEYDFAVVSML